MPQPTHSKGFTLIELLVVIAVVIALVGILMPALSKARRQARTTVCQSRLRNLGQGLAIYANENDDLLVPGRMPKIDNEHWQIPIAGGVKYRPTFLAMMAAQIGMVPFDDPQPTKSSIDTYDQPGDRQNYASEIFVCPETRNWTDERNGSYGYNYQFLGNARLRDGGGTESYKNWPVLYSGVKSPSGCVAVADCTGTAAAFRRVERTGYEDNLPNNSSSGRTVTAMGNEGFNLDPPRVDPQNGEIAVHGGDDGIAARTAVDERHGSAGSVLWVDGHVSPETLDSLGYEVDEENGVVGEGYDPDLANNAKFHAKRRNEAWLK